MDNPTGYGIPWYEPEDYQEMRLLLKNPGNMPRAYDDWLILFEHGCKQLMNDGMIPIKVKLDAPTFTAWCLINKQPIHSKEVRNFLTFEGERRYRGRN